MLFSLLLRLRKKNTRRRITRLFVSTEKAQNKATQSKVEILLQLKKIMKFVPTTIDANNICEIPTTYSLISLQELFNINKSSKGHKQSNKLSSSKVIHQLQRRESQVTFRKNWKNKNFCISTS